MTMTVLRGFLAIALLAISLAACAPADVASQRASYDVTLIGWSATELTPPGPDPLEEPAAEGDAAAEPATAPDAPDGDEGDADDPALAEPSEPVKARINLAFEVTNNGGDLDQLTLDITQADEGGAEKARHRVTIDVTPIPRGLTSQADAVLEDVEIGARRADNTYPDQFAVQVQPNVPASERGAYPEFGG